jgi:CubicO group peptidase (beta-lactamase class C family)
MNWNHVLLVCLWLGLASCGAASGETGAGSAGAPTTPSASPTPAPPAAPPTSPSPPPPSAETLRAERAVAYALETGARAVVIRNATSVVAEGYGPLGGTDRGEPLASGSKSFSCPLMLLAEADGLLRIDELATVYLPQWRAGGIAPGLDRKAGIRLDNLLSMTAGLANDGASGTALNGVDSYAQAIMDRSAEAPDQVFRYGPNSFQAALALFQMATGGTARADGGVDGGRDPLAYLADRLFVPLGIAPTGWSRDARGQPNFGGGAEMTARHWARYGQLFLDDGRVADRQILPPGALARCTAYQNPAFLPYGLGFWLNRDAESSVGPEDSMPVPGDVRRRWEAGGRYAPSVPASMFFAWGAGNAKMFILPSHGLVAVRIGGGGDDDQFLGILIGTRN